MTKEDVGWQQLMNRWINKKPEREAELLRTLFDRYVSPTLEFLCASTSVPPRPGAAPTRTKYKALEHVVFTSEINMIETLIALVEVRVVTRTREQLLIKCLTNCLKCIRKLFDISTLGPYLVIIWWRSWGRNVGSPPSFRKGNIGHENWKEGHWQMVVLFSLERLWIFICHYLIYFRPQFPIIRTSCQLNTRTISILLPSGLLEVLW